MEIDCQSVNSRLQSGDEFLLLDCREADEHEYSNIQAATLIPMSEIQDRVDELTPHRDSDIVVYCHHGMRSLQVAHWLKNQGFANVMSMAGGIDRWSLEIDPTIARY